MATQSANESKMALGITAGYRHIGFKPPLGETQVQQLPAPEGDIGRGGRFMPFVSLERDGSMTIGIDAMYFCEPYQIKPADCVNCVIVDAKRADRSWLATCMIPATIQADINGIVRKELDARKISFASMDKAVNDSKMAFGAITPIGLPAGWPILIDSSVPDKEQVVIGSGVRNSKLLVSDKLLASLPGAKVLSLIKSQ